MKFPVLAIDPKGFTELFRIDAETRRISVAFIGIYRKLKETLEFFDSDGALWKLTSVDAVKPGPLWSRILHPMRETDVVMQFQLLGPCPLARMKETFRKAVDADDDILTQHEETEDILAKLAQTKSVG